MASPPSSANEHRPSQFPRDHQQADLKIISSSNAMNNQKAYFHHVIILTFWIIFKSTGTFEKKLRFSKNNEMANFNHSHFLKYRKIKRQTCKHFYFLNNWLWKGPFYSHSNKVTHDEQIVLEEGGRAAKNFDQHLRRFQRDSLSSAAWKYSRRSKILNGHYDLYFCFN